MKRYVIYGASDDLIEVDVYALGPVNRGAVSGDEHGVTSDQRGTFTMLDPSGAGVRVLVAYEDSGCWSIGVSPIDEETAVPDGWHLSLLQGGHDNAGKSAPAYSMALVADVPDDTSLTWEGTRS